MNTLILVIFGLCSGSFVNALVWRVHEQSKKPGDKALSVLHGRSMCPNCKKTLSAQDLIPVLSWVFLRGKCRYCSKNISVQYPVVELGTAILFVVSYACWPDPLRGAQVCLFIVWLILAVGLVALFIYDLKWYLLPNRIIYPTLYLAILYAIISVIASNQPVKAIFNEIMAVAVGGGIFYVIFQLSDGNWIGGGDVRLGGLLGLVAGTPGRSLLFMFLASLVGSLISVPLLLTNRLQRQSIIPFGPFLIAGAILTQLFGADLLQWYQHLLFGV